MKPVRRRSSQRRWFLDVNAGSLHTPADQGGPLIGLRSGRLPASNLLSGSCRTVPVPSPPSSAILFPAVFFTAAFFAATFFTAAFLATAGAAFAAAARFAAHLFFVASDIGFCQRHRACVWV